jgi:hypothetical protein
LNSFRVKRLSRLDFPTPESPISTTMEVVSLQGRQIGGRAGVAGTFEEKLRRVSERNLRAGIVHTSYSSFAIVAGKDLRKGDGCGWCFRGVQQKLRDQERMMRRPRLDLARSWRAFAFCYWAWGGCNCKNVGACDCQREYALRKATFCPLVAAAVTCAIKSWQVIV